MFLHRGIRETTATCFTSINWESCIDMSEPSRRALGMPQTDPVLLYHSFDQTVVAAEGRKLSGCRSELTWARNGPGVGGWVGAADVAMPT